MNIIFIHRRLRKPVTLQLQGRAWWLLMLPMLVLPMMGGAVAYGMLRHEVAVHPATTAMASNNDAANQLRAMSQRMAELQAHITRLDALGQHLAESNNLKSKEFDFQKKPMGGEETPTLTAISSQTALQMRLQTLRTEVDDREAQLTALDSVLQGRQHTPQVLLSNSPLRGGEETSPFGYRVDPINGRVSFHPGIDFAGPEGSGIYATASGVVSWAGPRNGYGNMVEINHGNGLYTHYAHCSNVTVHQGDVVSTGQLIAHMGSTGRSTGPHLHYEVLENGVPVNPATFLALNH
ncbi:MAG: M23 family metallopeptidase [Pseudomonadales bacterium]|nr:M23 family metallopeptidase [Pseudomonadales bacterium]